MGCWIEVLGLRSEILEVEVEQEERIRLTLAR